MRTDYPRCKPAHVKKARLLRSFLRGRPILCTWQLSHCCESQCFFCEARREIAEQDLTFDECVAAIERLDDVGSLVVSLCGGDPMLRNDIVEIVRRLASSHIPRVITQGAPVSRKKARAVWLAGLRVASVRLFDADPERHDERAGHPGAHASAMDALRALRDERTDGKQRVDILIPCGFDDIDAIERILETVAPLGVNVSIDPLKEKGIPQTERFVSERLLNLKRRFPHLRSSIGFLARLDQAMQEGIANCRAGRLFFSIDHRGRISRCMERRAPEDFVGDILQTEIGDILAVLRRRATSDPCRDCWRSARGEMEMLLTMNGILGAIPRMVRA